MPSCLRQLRLHITNAGQTIFSFGKFINGDTRLNSQVEETQIFAMAGLEGKLGEYDWELGFVHGDAKLDNTNVNNTNNFHLLAALDAVTVTSAMSAPPDCQLARPFAMSR